MKTKQTIKTILSLLLVLLLALSAAPAAMAADGAVTYEGGAEKFVFVPGSEYSDSDLFDNFKNVMPGDSVSQEIVVKNNTNTDVKIYLRAKAHHETDNPLSSGVAEQETVASMEDFLEQLHMTVSVGKTKLFDATPAYLDGLAENVLLGQLKSKEGAYLTVTLNVPIELGNEYANRVGEVDWVFTVEEISGGNPGPGPGPSPGPGGNDPVTPPDEEIDDPDVPLGSVDPEDVVVIPGQPVEEIEDGPVPTSGAPINGNAPKTGDNAKTGLMLALLIAAMAGLVVTRKSGKHE